MTILGTVICGFLGSGKTTFINRLLRSPHGKRLAVLVNELGEMGLDTALLEKNNMGDVASIIELDNGCLCCALNQDLEQTLKDLPRDRLDLVLIETTGVADPLTILWTFTRPSLENAYRPNLIVTLVDAIHFRDSVSRYPIARLQIEQAHVLLITKTEACSAAEYQSIRDDLAAINPYAPMARVEDESAVSLVLDMWPEHASTEGETDLHDTHLSCDHSHHAFESVSISAENLAIDRDRLEQWLDALPSNIVRVKGVIRSLSDDGCFLVVHKVADEVSFAFRPVYDGSLGIVLIGQALDSLALQTAFRAACTA